MKPFSTIAIPHKDILEGRLTMDVFAADLWEVFKRRAPEEYQDPDIFFKKTYLTSGLKNILDIAEKRLRGNGGDPIIQIQTPFGGGKTHSLIALYHKAKKLGINVIVFSGDKFSAGENEPTLWEEIERQLEGRIENLKGKVTPGGEKLRDVLQRHQPLMILLDEIHEYIAVKALGVKVGDSNLAIQTIAFLQDLTGIVKTLDKTILIVSLPSSNLYQDEKSEKLLQELQNILGRMEKVYTPVQDEEISDVIRRRLFSEVKEEEARKTIEEFLKYAEREKILPEGVDKINYRERFIKSFPFQPEVIDVLYKRWGSIPSFQRTRGVLRILALVVHSLKNSDIPFIRLGDFDLKNDEIRMEFIKHIGQEYNSIIAADITSSEAGAKNVDRSLGDAYSSFSFGTKSAIAIFMYSFSGRGDRGATINDVKLSCADLSTPSNIVEEAVSKLRDNLIYISDVGLFFTNQPNLNRIHLIKMENIEAEQLKSEEKNLLTNSLTKEYFDIYIWPDNPREISDTTRLKLVILTNHKKCKDILENYGERPRVYRNTLIFLCPLESERINFDIFLKEKLAWHFIEEDKTLHITDEQRKEVRAKIKKAEDEVKERIRSLYRLILLPSKNEFKEIDLGIPTYGADVTINREVYERLRNEGEILEKLSALTLKEKYLKDRDYVKTRNILESFYKTPGEIRIVSDDVLKTCIKEGVSQGLFGVGVIEDGKTVCSHFKEEFSPEIGEEEIIIRAELCSPKPEQKKKLENEEIKRKEELQDIVKPKEKYNNINLKLIVPFGKLYDFVKIVNNIQKNFKQVNVRVEISAQDGEMAHSEYEDKIKEAINQAKISVEYEELK
ncbi:MAG: DUF499 domain-containing protein [Thermoplasmatales archaeon]